MKKPYLILLSLIALLFAGSWIYHGWAGRGLITLTARNAPLLEVLHKMERQSGFSMLARTNMTQKVTVRFDRVPVEQALDVLADQVEGRWQKVFLIGRNKASLRALAAKVAQQGAPFLITSARRMGMGASDDSLNPEKLQQGPVTPLAGAHPLQEAALAVAVRSATPVVVQEGLNPAVKPSASSFSSVAKAVRALAGAAAARWEQAYEFRVGRRGGSGFVEGAGPRRGEGEGSRERGGQGFPGFGGGDAGGTNHPFAVQTTLLTDEQRVEMERARVERQQRLAEFQAMTPAQRLQRVAEMVDGGGSAAAQQRHQQRMLRRIMNTTPEQKVKMNQRMEQRLQRLQQRLQQQSSAPAPQRGR